MVTVPLYEPDVRSRPIFQQGVDVRASPEAFGAGVGRGLQAVAEGVASVGDAAFRVQQLADEARTKDARVAWSAEADKAWADPDTGYAHATGAKAVDGRKAYEERLAKAKREITADMTADQRARFDREIAPQEWDAVSRGMLHAGNETKKFVADSALASTENYATEAARYAANPAKRTEYLSRGVQEIKALSEKLGWPQEKLKLEAQKYVSGGHVRIAGELAKADPIAGLQYLTEKKTEILPEDAGQAMRALVDIAKDAVTADGTKSRSMGGVAAGSAADVIRSFEGYRDTPYWDVNAHRIGFGSDTVTREDGSAVPVVKGMKITRADAERDLDRRINVEFVPGIKKMVGADKWSKLPASAQAALASVAYNYGSLPFSVANAVVMGDLDTIADAVEGLKGHNGGVNAKRRGKEAAMIRSGDDTGSAAPGAGSEVASSPAGDSGPTFSPRVEGVLAGLPGSFAAELREAAQKGIAATEAKDAAAYKAERAAVADSYRLRVAEGDLSLTREEILGNAVMDDGDKAAILNSFNEKNRELIETQRAVAAFQVGTLAIDPYDASGRKMVDNAWTAISAATPEADRVPVLNEFVRQAGIVPQPVVNAVRGVLAVGSPQEVAKVAGLAAGLSLINPAAFGRRDGGKEIQDAAAIYSHLTDRVGLDPITAGQRLVDLRDPEKVRERAALMKSDPIEKFVKDQATETNVRDLFDPGVFATDPRLGETPAQAAAMVGEYRDALEESLFDAGGDTEAGKALAADRFRRRYGVSDYSISGPKVVARLPPELTYPAGKDGTHSYIGEQAKASLAVAGVTADRVYLVADDLTERDVSSGRPARYNLFYEDDGVIERYNFPFYADAPAASEIGAAARAASEQRRNQNRAILEAGRDREGTLDRFLDGNPLTGGLENLSIGGQ